MNELIQNVWDMSAKIMEEPYHVTVNEGQIKIVAKELKEAVENSKEFWLGYPKCIYSGMGSYITFDTVLYDLIASAVNYQYWFGKHDFRPNGACANVMYKLLSDAFVDCNDMYKREQNPSGRGQCVIDILIRKMTFARFPNLRSRIERLQEIRKDLDNSYGFVKRLTDKIEIGEENLEDTMWDLVDTFPGFAEDLFLKRANIFFMMLYRRTQWFKEDIATLPVPADYQVPKMLAWKNCIIYSPELQDDIDRHILIPSGSLKEVEIRAATVEACRLLAEHSGCTVCDIDTYLWTNRKKCKDPFHLTITTDY